MAALLNPQHPRNAADIKEAEELRVLVGALRLHILSASTEDEIVAAFTTLDSLKVGALLVGPDPFFLANRRKIVALAANHAMPAVYELRDFADDGGLMSYGTSIADAYYQAGIYAARILKGEKPGDLPVMQSTKFKLVINLKTAKMLGPDHSADAARARRQGDRISCSFGCNALSVCGPKPKCRHVCDLVVIGA